MAHRSSRVWQGIVVLLIAAVVLANQISDFAHIGVGSLIVIAIALLAIALCVARLKFAALPVPFAALYFVLQAPLDLPFIRLGILVLIAFLAYLGLKMLLPRMRRRQRVEYGDSHEEDEQSSDGNAPSLTVNFGSTKYRLRADALETARLHCSFGSMKLAFEEVELSANGAEAVVSCSFGTVKLFVPEHWQIVDQVNCSMGSVDIGKRFFRAAQDAPKLTLSGNVSFGGVEVRRL